MKDVLRGTKLKPAEQGKTVRGQELLMKDILHGAKLKPVPKKQETKTKTPPSGFSAEVLERAQEQIVRDQLERRRTAIAGEETEDDPDSDSDWMEGGGWKYSRKRRGPKNYNGEYAGMDIFVMDPN